MSTNTFNGFDSKTKNNFADQNKKIERTYLNVMDVPYDAKIHGEFEGEFEKEHFKTKFKWDDFQLHAFQAIKRGDNVLVVAPTSSGKTSVAKYAALLNLLQRGTKVVYTTPTKSLSNEKYEEMAEVLKPYGIVPGLLTGDQKINVDSMFLIMTAEILSIALFMLDIKKQETKTEVKTETKIEVETETKTINNNKSHYDLNHEFVESIGCVIMDEIHFISDRSRGYAWEYAIIMLNPKVQIVGLSATIRSPEYFASWIGQTKEHKITLVKKYDRPVPLEYKIYDGSKLHMVLDTDGEYYAEAFNNSLRILKQDEKKHELNKTNRVNFLLNNFIKYSRDNNLLQLCFIVFSKKNCEIFAGSVSINLMSGKESSLAVNELEKKMGLHLKSYQNMPRFRQIKGLITKGVCFHHAGLPVVMKEVIEHMFKTGHIKVLFATETVAIGVNMPIRTLILPSLEKSVGDRNNHCCGTKTQAINAAEFKQICGRAGRRGLDSKGLIVFLPLYDFPSESHIRGELLFGQLPVIKSTMELTYHSYLKLLLSDVIDRDTFFDKSLMSVTNNEYLNLVEIEIVKLFNELENSDKELEQYILINNICDDVLNNIKEYFKRTDQKNTLLDNVQLQVQVKQTKQQLKNLKLLEDSAKSNKELYDLMHKNKILHNAYDSKLSEKNNMERYKNDRFKIIGEFLLEAGYIDGDDSATEYGKIAASINECNPFILTEIFTGNILQTLTPTQIVCLLSILTDRLNKTDREDISLVQINIDKIVKDAIEYIEERIQTYISLETNLNISSDEFQPGFWDLSYDYLELSQLWAKIDLSKEDHTEILQLLDEYGEYEGSFIKNMLKINNIVGNLIALCKSTQNLDILPVLQEVEKLIIKGMVNVDSIHVVN